MLMTVNKIIFIKITFYAENQCTNFKMLISNATLLNESDFHFLSRTRHKKVFNVREWSMLDCFLVNSGFGIFVDYSEITIHNTAFVDMFG